MRMTKVLMEIQSQFNLITIGSTIKDLILFCKKPGEIFAVNG